LADAQLPQIPDQVLGLIAPHAGYRYSGQVAAYAYKSIKGMNIKRVILIGPSHRIPFRGISVNLVKGYRTPLGAVSVDQELARRIMELNPAIRWIRHAHRVEHSLEIQLPFLQIVLKDFKIVPVLIGIQDWNTCQMLANVLEQAIIDSAIEPGGTLLVASTDLSHYHPYRRAVSLDKIFIEHVGKMDPYGLYSALISGECEACGGGAAVSLLLYLRRQKARALILKYANSGDVTGEKERVVGYMASAFFRSSDKGPHQR